MACTFSGSGTGSSQHQPAEAVREMLPLAFVFGVFDEALHSDRQDLVRQAQGPRDGRRALDLDIGEVTRTNALQFADLARLRFRLRGESRARPTGSSHTNVDSVDAGRNSDRALPPCGESFLRRRSRNSDRIRRVDTARAVSGSWPLGACSRLPAPSRVTPRKSARPLTRPLVRSKPASRRRVELGRKSGCAQKSSGVDPTRT